ncbi:carbamoyltransferase HypF [Candidatus Bathyarchaeota archaeon]|nr:carbamoyltransferase HypF [Candidatus Bathyarchaeota archaeon]
MRVKIRVAGIVQGVGFRPFVYRIASKNHLNGYVRNKGDAGVEIVVEGKEKHIEKFLSDLVEKSPSMARIHDLTTSRSQGRKRYGTFRILKSSEETEQSGSVIPPDIATCNECLKELRNSADPRYEYFFITCTNCGPRFTIVEQLPYDRENTTMRQFPLCSFCRKEYTTPANRRFHAQTVACSKRGPKIYLTANKGEKLESKDPVREAGKFLSEGSIVGIKGYGGFHIACATTQDGPLTRLRQAKHRRQKPFAIMARNLEITRSFAEISPKEVALLESYIRPVVLLNKRKDYSLSDLIAPGLHNLGVMLPYTALHCMLFDDVDDPAFVMTSANPPNQPIINDDQEALDRLGSTVDYFLFHNRRIAHRCDDSVIRIHSRRRTCLTRRSRGYVPAPIHLKIKSERCALGLGGELNVTSCIIKDRRAFLSQHIGDVENVETLKFLEDATRHLVKLTSSKVEIVACDLHPRFNTTSLAYRLAEELDCPMKQVQHHHAHVAALMAEHNLDEIIGIVCDGYGYGPKGEAWGGEILHCDHNGFRRLGHLEEQPMLGGDLATYYPIRVAAAILNKTMDIKEWVLERSETLPHGRTEAELIIDQLDRDIELRTSSCGRILDGLSSVLGICYERTYEGEPAMKLEAAARGGAEILSLEPKIKGDIICTTDMLYAVFSNVKKLRIRDLAFSAENYLAKSLAALAIEKAQELGVTNIGLSGGVACNEHISTTMLKIVEGNGYSFIFHKDIPPGDGGTSLGQAIVTSLHSCRS